MKLEKIDRPGLLAATCRGTRQGSGCWERLSEQALGLFRPSTGDEEHQQHAIGWWFAQRGIRQTCHAGIVSLVAKLVGLCPQPASSPTSSLESSNTRQPWSRHGWIPGSGGSGVRDRGPRSRSALASGCPVAGRALACHAAQVAGDGGFPQLGNRPVRCSRAAAQILGGR